MCTYLKLSNLNFLTLNSILTTLLPELSPLIMTKVRTARCAARKKRDRRRKIMPLPTVPFARQPLSERIREAEELADFEREYGTRAEFEDALAKVNKLEKVNKLKKKAKGAKRRADDAMRERIREAEEFADFERNHGTRAEFEDALAKVNKLKKKAKEAKRRADEAMRERIKALSM